MTELDAVLQTPTGFSDPRYFEFNVRIVGYIYGRHRDAHGYNSGGECAMAVYVSEDGRLCQAPIDWFVIRRPLPSPPKEG